MPAALLRAVTCVEPWATLIALGVKTVESRRWAPPMAPVTLFIHSAQHRYTNIKALSTKAVRDTLDAHHVDITPSCVLAVVRCVSVTTEPTNAQLATPWAKTTRERNLMFWQLDPLVEQLRDPIESRGNRRTWIPDPGLVADVRAQIPGSFWLDGASTTPPARPYLPRPYRRRRPDFADLYEQNPAEMEVTVTLSVRNRWRVHVNGDLVCGFWDRAEAEDVAARIRRRGAPR